MRSSGLVLEEHEHDGSSGTRLTQVCKMNIDTKDEDYNYGFTGALLAIPGGKMHLLQYMNAY